MSDTEIALRNNRKCQKKHQKTFALLNFKHVLCNPIFRRKLYKKSYMSRVCQVTGKRSMVGNNVGHSNLKTKRKFHANLFKKKFYYPEEDRWITLKVSASGLRDINKKGLHKMLQEAKAAGYINNY